MRGLFVKPDDTVNISVYVGSDVSGRIVAAASAKDLKKQHKHLEDNEIEELGFEFRRPNFKDSLQVVNNMFKTEGMGTENVEFSLDAGEARLVIITSLIKSWNLTDDDGKAVKPTVENIQSLNPVVAFQLANLLELQIGQLI